MENVDYHSQNSVVQAVGDVYKWDRLNNLTHYVALLVYN